MLEYCDLYFLCKIVVMTFLNHEEESRFYNIINNTFNCDTKTTIGVNFGIKDIFLPEVKGFVRFQIWDLNMQEHFMEVNKNYLTGSNALIIILNSKEGGLISKVQKKVNQLKTRYQLTKTSYPILVLVDKEDFNLRSRIFNHTLAKVIGVDDYFECDLKTGNMVEETFQMIAKLLTQNLIKHSIGRKILSN
jgi:GTPase SAR1 family protein